MVRRFLLSALFAFLGFFFTNCEAEQPFSENGRGDTDADTDGDVDGGTDEPSDSDGDTDTIDAPPGCGDGELTEDEACDDGNQESGDGCAGNCLSVEEGYSCNPPGQPCHQVAMCGDGVVFEPELCDDGNILDGDGCDDTCKVEIGSTCYELRFFVFFCSLVSG